MNINFKLDLAGYESFYFNSLNSIIMMLIYIRSSFNLNGFLDRGYI